MQPNNYSTRVKMQRYIHHTQLIQLPVPDEPSIQPSKTKQKPLFKYTLIFSKPQATLTLQEPFSTSGGADTKQQVLESQCTLETYLKKT